MNKREIASKCEKTYAPIWAPPADFIVAGGNKEYLHDKNGKQMIDFVTGIAVNALGYNHPKLVRAFKQCAGMPLHASALFLQEDRIKLSEMLVKRSFGDRVFFCNSGTEGIEAVIKFSRKWAFSKFGGTKNKIIVFKNGFHGRSYGALSATAQEKFHEGFKPMVPGFIYLPTNEIGTFLKAADPKKVCAVLVEPLQAEGGLLGLDRGWIRKVRQICNTRNILLAFDEIQTGMGRLGTLWGYQEIGVVPDIMALAKALGGGIPFGAVVMKNAIASCLKVGDHGNTTGGSPVAARLGIAMLNELLKPGFFQQVRIKERLLRKELSGLKKAFPKTVTEVRGYGMLQGIVVTKNPGEIIDLCRKKGLLICKAGKDVVRLIPPLNVRQKVIKEAVEKLAEVLKAVS